MFKLTPDMCIDEGPIDQDHRRLFMLANRVIELRENESSAPELNRCISELYRYVKIHFDREEELMQKHNYPLLQVHHESHGKIVKQMNEYLTTADEFPNLISNFQDLMKVWIHDHILEEDLRFGRYLKDGGAKKGKVRIV